VPGDPQAAGLRVAEHCVFAQKSVAVSACVAAGLNLEEKNQWPAWVSSALFVGPALTVFRKVRPD
jgi:hypothetical protein